MNLPTKITFSRIILIVLMIITLATLHIIGTFDYTFFDIGALTIPEVNINKILLGVCVVFIIAASTDAIDGRLARKNNQVTDLGKFLDPVADKLLVNSMVIYLCVAYYEPYVYFTQRFIFPVFCAIIIILRDTVVDALRFIAAKKNVVIAANIFGKAKTVAEMITIPIALLNGWPFTYFDIDWGYGRIVYILVYITTFLSLLSGIIYIVQNRHVLKESN